MLMNSCRRVVEISSKSGAGYLAQIRYLGTYQSAASAAAACAISATYHRLYVDG